MAVSALKATLPRLKETTAAKISVVYNDHRSRTHRIGHGAGLATDHADSEGTWIFSYADMITILMMFFILLLSISSLDVQKFEELKGALASTVEKKKAGEEKGNAGENANMSTSGISESQTQMNVEPGIGNVPFRILAEKAAEFSASDNNAQLIAAIQTLMAAVDTKALSKSAKQAQEFEAMRGKLAQMNNVIRDEMTLEGKKNQEIKISIASKGMFDEKGGLTPKGQSTFASLAKSTLVLDPFPQITIATFVATSEEPDARRAVALSNERASAVFAIFSENKVLPDLIAMAGYGHSKPMVSERDPYGNAILSGQQKNSRIEISIQRRKDYRK